MSYSNFSQGIMELRYSHVKPDGTKETWCEIAERVVNSVLSVVEVPKDYRSELIRIIDSRKFIPGGRFLAQAGRPYHQTSNCFMLRAEDTREGWGELMRKSTVMLMSGGGIGVDYSDIRPKGAVLKRSGGTSSGVLPLANVVNEIGRGVMAGGNRRSAIYASLRWNHADVMDFVRMKDWPKYILDQKVIDFDTPAKMDMTNMSVILDREFFEAYDNPSHGKHSWAHEIYWLVINSMVKTAEPGFQIDYNNQRESLRNAPVCGDTYVLTSSGYVQVKDIVDHEVNLFTGKQFAENVRFTKTKSSAEIVSVSMTGGRQIRCDKDHEFFVKSSFWKSRKKITRIIKVKAKDLKSGDSLLIQLPAVIDESEEINKESYTLGYLYGDGSFSASGKAECTLCTDESKKCLPYLKSDLLSSVTEKDPRGYTRLYYKTDQKFLGRSKDAFPEEIYSQSISERASFVAGLWDADGNFSRGTTYRLSSIHPEFLRGVSRVLESLGILSHVNKNGFSTFGKRQTYQLVVSSDFACTFSKLIPTVRVLRPDLQNYRSYRESFVKVTDIKNDGREDVYCVDVRVEEHSFMAEGVIISNCTEVVSEDDSDVCVLGSVNLGMIENLDELKYVTELGQLFLLAGTEYTDRPTDDVRIVQEKNRRTGLGLMGLHQWLITRGKPYGRDAELAQWLQAWKDTSRNAADQYSSRFDWARPVATRAIAPNGSISIAGGRTTSGIEPIFAVAYKRRFLSSDGWKHKFVVDPVAEQLIQGGVDPDKIEDAYSLSMDVERRIDFQSFVQEYVDNAISSTINLPQYGYPGNDDVESFGKMLYPHLPNLRGITCYPDGSRSGQPLSVVPYSYAMKHKDIIFESNEECSSGVCGL